MGERLAQRIERFAPGGLGERDARRDTRRGSANGVSGLRCAGSSATPPRRVEPPAATWSPVGLKYLEPSRSGGRAQVLSERVIEHVSSVTRDCGSSTFAKRPTSRSGTRTAPSRSSSTASSTTSWSSERSWRQPAIASRPNADTEVLVHLYEAADGDIAAMLHRGSAACSRSRCGTIDAVVSCSPVTGSASSPCTTRAAGRRGRVRVRSERARHGADWSTRAPTPHRVVGYLLWGSVQGPRTILGGVRSCRRALPGWDERTARVGVWWQPAFEPVSSVTRWSSSRALSDAVRRHLVADREVGLFLSGGVDSGSSRRGGARRAMCDH